MAEQPIGRRRADGKISLLDQLELRNKQIVASKNDARRKRAEARAQASAERIERMLEVESSVRTGQVKVFTSRIVSGVSKKTFRRNIISGLTFSISAALFATFALPAYGFSPEFTALAGLNSANAQAIANSQDTQGLTVVQVKYDVVSSRGGQKTVNAALLRTQTLTRYRAWTGYSAEDFLKNPPYDAATGDSVVTVASKYIGVPYVFGGSTPGGFDCSGFTRYVFAQFGVDLAHSVSTQNGEGKLIRPSDAKPGDLVVWNDLSHEGIYVGGGNMIHAPKPGDSVKIAPIFSPYVHFIRIYK